jgi:tRNA threonylcarbamoyladenosine biosynthesis protein TsaE
MVTITHSEEQTEKYGEQLASKLKAGDCLALYGPLGSGKTALTRGICSGLGCDIEVHSPTFNIINFYPGDIDVAHVDLYRIDDYIEDIGWNDLLATDCLIIIEWAEKASNYLPDKRTDIFFKIIDLNTREIKMEELSDSGD